MDLNRIVDRYLLKTAFLAPDAREMLFRIDQGDYHTLPLKGIKPAERPVLDQLVKLGLIRVVRTGHLPPHFVLTNRGIHEMGTFKGIFARMIVSP